MTSRPTLEDQLPALLQRGVPEPPRSLDGASIRTARVASSRSALRWAAPALAALVVVATAVAVPLAFHRHHSTATRQDVAAVNTQRRADTASVLQRVLASFSVPSSWQESSRSLSKDIAVPTDDPGSYLLTRARLWTTTDDADTAIEHLTAHLPAGITLGTGVDHTADFASVLLDPSRQVANATDYGGLAINAFAERLHSGQVGVALRASAYWLPVRTPQQTVPSDVTGAEITLTTGLLGQRTVHHARLKAGAARTLARDINRLPVTYQPVGDLCPASGAPSATVTFASPVGLQRLGVSTYCPSGVTVQPRMPGMDLDLVLGRTYATILTLLGLPADYGHK